MSWLNVSSLGVLALAGGVCIMACATPYTSDSGAARSSRPAPPSPVVTQLGTGPLALSAIPPNLQLPDLKQELQFVGLNSRPDRGAAQIQLKLRDGESRMVAEGEPTYLRFDGSYRFSEEPTQLWVVPRLESEKLSCEVEMERSDGTRVVTPEKRRHFTLAKSQVRGEEWHLGKLRVDSSLLARMRARWFGEDLFLARHGGEEFAEVAGKQRIDFGEGPNLYSLYLAPEELLTWDGERWQQGGESEGRALLQLARVDEKALRLELWNPEGNQQTSLSLARSRDAWLPAPIRDQLRFVAAKTHAQFLLQIEEERIAVEPGEWLLFGEEGWQSLTSIEEVDNYVARRMAGELLVIDGLRKEGGQQILLGHLFNRSRSGIKQVELALAPDQREARMQMAEEEVE